MGWSADDFWFSTPSFFYAAFAGHIEQERDRFNQGLAAARIVAYYAVAPHLEKGKSLKLSDIVRLPGDEEERMPVFDQISPEEMAAFSAAADKAYLQLAGKEWQVSHN